MSENKPVHPNKRKSPGAPRRIKKNTTRRTLFVENKEHVLTDMQENFCMYYVYGAFGEEISMDEDSWRENFNAVQAYLAAGGTDYGKLNTNRDQVMRMFRMAHIRKRIKELVDERNQQVVVDKLWVIKSLKELAKKSATDSVKVRALELLGKHLDIFTERHVVEDATGPAELAKAAYERSKARFHVVDSADESVAEG